MAYLYEMQPAFVGMKADSMFDNVDTFPCGEDDIAFGVVFGHDPTTGKAVLPVGTLVGGIALHDQVIASVHGKYVENTAISGLTRGRVWARAGGACTKGAAAKYDPATGVFSDAGTATYPNARFKGSVVSSGGILPGDPSQSMVLVELHDPSVDAT